MRYKEYSTPQGSIEYYENDKGIVISGYRGRDIEVEIPEFIDDMPVVKLDKKAFLSAKSMRKLLLPITVTDINDFAFAYCSNLKSISLSANLSEIGTAVFKECNRLQEIHVNGFEEEVSEKQELDQAYLLGATVGILEAVYLFRPGQIHDKDWIPLWDTRMMSIMNVDDMEGYSKLLLCGEEDYGSNENHPDVYKSNRIKGKVRLAMLRLMHDYGLQDSYKDFLIEYLNSYKKGCDSDETWKVVLEEHGDEKEYYELLTSLSLVDETNLQDMLKDMGEAHAEMKAYLLNFFEGDKKSSFFDALDL